MTPDQLAVLTASAAALLFIEATLCSIFAQASLPATDTASDLRRSYDNMSKKWYYGAIFCWTVGLPCLLVSLGALAHRSVTWTLPAAIIAAAITLILSIGSTIRS